MARHPATRHGVAAVGGIRPETMRSYVEAGANGFGLGSALYKPGMSERELAGTAAAFVTAWREIVSG